MKQRLYFIAPDRQTAQTIVTGLQANGVSDEQIGVIARSDQAIESLPDASRDETVDTANAVQRGLLAGGATGLLVGLGAMILPLGFAIGGGMLLAGTTLGAGFGAWVAALVGSSVPNSQIQLFEEEIRRGRLLVLVDVEEERVDQIRGVIETHLPEVEYEGSRPEIRVVPHVDNQ